MFNIEDDDFAIEKIDTTRPVRPTPREMLNLIKELQDKVNEIVEMVNVLSLPDDEEAMKEDDEDDDIVVVGKPVPKPSRK